MAQQVDDLHKGGDGGIAHCNVQTLWTEMDPAAPDCGVACTAAGGLEGADDCCGAVVTGQVVGDLERGGYANDTTPAAAATRGSRLRGGCCEVLGGVLYMLALYAITAGLIAFAVWCNYEVGYAAKWGLTFLIGFVGVPLLFAPLFVLGFLPCKPDGWGVAFVVVFVLVALFYAFSIGFPVAITANRMATADRLSSTTGPLHVDANCWNHPQPSRGPENWNKEAEFIHWSDSDWYIERWRIRPAYIVEGSTVHTFCAAPIALKDSSPLFNTCTGYRAFAVCYCKHTSGYPCTEAEQDSGCGWNLKATDVVSRVIRTNGFYAAYSDVQEKAMYKLAMDGVSVGWPKAPANGKYEPLMVWWATDQVPEYFQMKGTNLSSSLRLQLILYGAVWGGLSFCCVCVALFLSLP